MASQYKQKLLAGEKELADKLRLLVQPLWKQYDTKEEQAVCLQELGELYLNAGVESKNGKDFTKAAALFNAALVRTSKEEVQKKIKGHLVVVRKEFMTAFYPDAKLILPGQWEERRMQNIHTLEKIRTNIKDNSNSLKLLMVRYDMEAKDVQEIEKCLVNEAKILTLLVQEEMLEFIRVLWNQSIPPCKYSMMGLGSLARQEVTPYSDLEFAILVKEKNDDVQRYFENLTNLFHLSVLDLGETPIPAMAIPSLNDFMTPGGDWFYDKITPSGLRLDGEMPWACKTPTGRQATCIKSQLSFINTPVEMAELLKSDSVLGQAYRVDEVLSRTIHIIGDLELDDIYQKEVVKVLNKSNKNRFLALINDLLETWMTEEKPYANAKIGYYRLPSIFVENLRLWLTPLFPGGSQWCTIENFVKIQRFSKEDAFKMNVFIALAYGLRILTYFSHNRQHEKIETHKLLTDPRMKSINDKMKQNLTSFIWRIILTNCPRYLSLIVLETLKNYPQCNLDINLSADPVPQMLKLMEDSRKEYARGYPSLLKCFYIRYFTLAIMDLGPRGLYCPNTCLGSRIHDLDCEKPNIEDFDFLLENTHLCSCVSMVKTYLKVHKYCSQRFLKLPTDPPNANLNYIIGELSKCKEERDILFLNFNLLKQAYFSTDFTMLKRVVTYVEHFLNTVVPRWAEKKYHKIVFRLMEYDFYWWLKHIYEFLGEYGKLTNLLEKWIDILEKCYPDGDFDLRHIEIYNELGKALLQNPEKGNEAICLWKKALKRLEVEISSTSSMDIHGRTLSKYVLTFAELLFNTKRNEESGAFVKEYFFNDNKSFYFTNGQILSALRLLAHCYILDKRWVEFTEVCEKIYHLIKVEGVGEHLSASDRTAIGNFFKLMYCIHGNIEDSLKAAECHKLACNMQKNTQLAVLEHKIYLLTSSLHFFHCDFTYMAIQYVAQVLALDPRTQTDMVDFSRTDMWLYLLVVLCDALDSFRSSVDTAVLFENYDITVNSLRNLSVFDKTTFELYQIYVQYRICQCLFSIAMDPEKYFVLKQKQTTDYLYQTQTRLTKFFPKCATAIEWCKDARLSLNPNAENIISQDCIKPSSLIDKAHMCAYRNRQERVVF